jgi:hypothetical protein
MLSYLLQININIFSIFGESISTERAPVAAGRRGWSDR